MKNRYLFRGKTLDNGEWIEGALLPIDDGSYRIASSCCTSNETNLLTVCAYEVDKNTICQCTDMVDNNGNLIYEHDIVKCPYENCYGNINWSETETGFYLDILLEDGYTIEEHIYDYEDDIEIVGNNIDNPELLEVLI